MFFINVHILDYPDPRLSRQSSFLSFPSKIMLGASIPYLFLPCCVLLFFLFTLDFWTEKLLLSPTLSVLSFFSFLYFRNLFVNQWNSTFCTQFQLFAFNFNFLHYFRLIDMFSAKEHAKVFAGIHRTHSAVRNRIWNIWALTDKERDELKCLMEQIGRVNQWRKNLLWDVIIKYSCT